MLKLIAKLLRALNAEGNPAQVSSGFTFGMMVGLVPLWNLTNFLLLAIVFIFRVNFSAFLLAFVFFSGFAYLLDPWLEQFGAALLTSPALKDFWSTLYSIDLFRLAHLHNTLVLGSLLCSLLAASPFFLVSNILVKKYREHILTWVKKTKLMKILKANKFYGIYRSISNTGAT